MKKIKKFLRTIKNKILVAHTSRIMLKNGLTREQQDRLDICKLCPYNSDNSSKITLKNKIYLVLNNIFNKLYNLKVSSEAICLYCGCNLFVKSSVDSDETTCDLGKWK